MQLDRRVRAIRIDGSKQNLGTDTSKTNYNLFVIIAYK